MNFHTNVQERSFTDAINELKAHFLLSSSEFRPTNWQGVDVSKRPEARMQELVGVNMFVPLFGIEDLDHWRNDIKPNLPWADDHFMERVCGQPLNPGTEWANWPWGKSADTFRDEHGRFNHNYMERYWPKYAGWSDQGELTETIFDPVWRQSMAEEGLLEDKGDPMPRQGIRWSYGDLNDVVDLLIKEPTTRQAYLPIFFPEDTGIGDGGRKPCTLGYQFMVRDNQLTIYYPMRSCDFYRHMQDDIYLTVRLGLWIIDRCRERSRYWQEVSLGSYEMHMHSLHMFVNDFIKLKQEQQS